MGVLIIQATNQTIHFSTSKQPMYRLMALQYKPRMKEQTN
uniref:Uncharacterized protein n=1 Tax=Anguilla anguilla TaxID=7936 RepID=A0A0E9RLJ5_ANGAN